MNITNKYNLPEYVVKLLDPRPRPKNLDRIGITDLEGPPRIRELTRRHFDEVEQDVSDFGPAFSGKAFHHYAGTILGDGDVLSEELVGVKVGDMEVVGVPDLYLPDGKVVDFKEVSAWALVFSPKGKPEEVWQVNDYAYLLREHGFPVTSGELCRKVKDWKKSEMVRNPDYPRLAFPHVVPVTLYTHEEVGHHIANRVALHRLAQSASDEELPECTPEERWEKATVYAVMKQGRKAAVKLFDEEKDAKGFMAGLGAGHSIQTRPGERTRCENYCPVAQFCNTFKAYKDAAVEEAA